MPDFRARPDFNRFESAVTRERLPDRVPLAEVGIDVGLLTRGSVAEVIAATKYLIENVAPRGGFALGSGNSIARYIPLRNYKAMLDTVRKCGRIY